MIDLVVEYDGGLNRETDDKIEKVLKGTGARRGGSGCCMFGEGTRDLCFSYPSVTKAKSAQKKLDAVKIKGVRTQVVA
jgi:hypothetical protein